MTPGKEDAKRAAGRLPLPEVAHLPGINARPAGGPVETVAKAAGGDDANDAAAEIAWHYGLRLLGAGFDWEAHEVLEPVWMRQQQNSAERELVQGLIQLANAALKVRMGRAGAAGRLARIAAAHIGEARVRGGAQVVGLSPDALVDVADRLFTVASGPCQAAEAGLAEWRRLLCKILHH